MKIIHAVWEKRNMGVDCYEVEIEPNDTIEEFIENKDIFETEYTVVKIASSDSNMGLAVQKEGYRFIETIVTVVKDSSFKSLNPIQKRLIEEMNCGILNGHELDGLYKEIKMGMFYTDRVSSDPYFTEEQSRNRYIGWLKDEIIMGATVYGVTYKKKPVGFFTLRENNGEFISALGGLYGSLKLIGCGFALPYFASKIVNELGGKCYVTALSSSNRGIFTTYMQLGCNVKYITSVYVGHFEKKN